ncbi:MAG TPA: hypothetical protein ENJ82_04210, partial [Bacteroidetes bacterium]|nr:hypothetical protein [Bacteroidota bacterium]
MERKQQLEQLGAGLVNDWQGRMALAGNLPIAPEMLLQDALPGYRTWLGDLWQMQQGWQGDVAGNASLFDAMLPWHWCALAQTSAQAHARANAATFRTGAASSAPVPPPHTRPPVFEVTPPKTKAVSPSKPALAGANSPHKMDHFDPRSHSQANTFSKGSHPKTELRSSKQKLEAPAKPIVPAKGQETPPEIVFRRLDDFAAFVQQPNARKSFQQDTPNSPENTPPHDHFSNSASPTKYAAPKNLPESKAKGPLKSSADNFISPEIHAPNNLPPKKFTTLPQTQNPSKPQVLEMEQPTNMQGKTEQPS